MVVGDVCEVVFVAVRRVELVELVMLWVVVVDSSLHPNQPGVLQVDVDDVVVVVVLVVVVDVVVVSSKHPHQPGVLQVDVRVFGLVDVEDVVVVLSLLFLVSSFQRGQS